MQNEKHRFHCTRCGEIDEEVQDHLNILKENKYEDTKHSFKFQKSEKRNLGFWGEGAGQEYYLWTR